ncbi:MAG: response regulator [Synechococcales bacterium]|nr:response regulator [Synechococcales bacterium]
MSPSLFELSILLVEDSSADAALLTRYLQQVLGKINLQWVTEGETALEILQAQWEDQDSKSQDSPSQDSRSIDLLILDLNLPGLSGREVFALLTADPTLCHLPVVILTTALYDQDILPIPSQPHYCYYLKPTQLSEYATVCQKIADFWATLSSLSF